MDRSFTACSARVLALSLGQAEQQARIKSIVDVAVMDYSLCRIVDAIPHCYTYAHSSAIALIMA
jgi:hypothetical protein